MSSEAKMTLNEGIPQTGVTGESDVVVVNDVSKTYQIYDRPSQRLRQFIFPRLFSIAKAKQRNYFTSFDALKDISLSIGKGEVVGIVGKNGSGKSTLLQIICGTLTPTSGIVGVHGRISALLELGSGFNPEFTGRENVYLNASLLGLTREETEGKIEDILGFADIGDFVDQAIHTYSSGMIVRLAFAVAINTSPDILIIDEALAVGDELFQRKCYSKLEQLRSQGTTILFVSHAAGTVIELCDRAILLDSGRILADGRPKEVISLYQKLLYSPEADADQIREDILLRRGKFDLLSECDSLPTDSGDHSVAKSADETHDETYDPAFLPDDVIVFGSHGAMISNPEIRTMDGRLVNGLIKGRKYRFCYRVAFSRTLTGVRTGMMIKTVSGLHLGGALSHAHLQDGMVFSAGQEISVEFVFTCRLNPAVYFLNAGVFGCAEEGEILLHRIADASVFRVLPDPASASQEIVDFDCNASVTIHA